MKLSLETILSYVLGGSMACAIMVLGLSFIYLQPERLPVAVVKEDPWPKAIALSANELAARAAIVYDPATGTTLFAKNEQESLPLASLTKLMSAEAILAKAGSNMSVSITMEDIAPEGDWDFYVGESWPLHDLLRFGLVASSNDAMAAAAAAGLGDDIVGSMNREALSLGLEKSYFLNPTGLDEDEETAGGYGSARDIAVLASIFLQKYPELFSATIEPVVSIGSGMRTLTATSTATPLLTIPGLRGAKTGYTDLAGGNLVAVFDVEVGRPLIIAVLGSTMNGRFADVKKLIDAVRAEE